MEIFRISKAKYSSELNPSGNAGRWNYRGEGVIYGAASRALASLEVLIHTSGEVLAGHIFKISVIHIPDNLPVNFIDSRHLPPKWNGLSPYSVTQPLGSAWLKSAGSVLLQVPSAIVIKEFNYILNVNHPDFKKIEITDLEDYFCDPRLVDKMNVMEKSK